MPAIYRTRGHQVEPLFDLIQVPSAMAKTTQSGQCIPAACHFVIRGPLHPATHSAPLLFEGVPFAMPHGNTRKKGSTRFPATGDSGLYIYIYIYI